MEHCREICIQGSQEMNDKNKRSYLKRNASTIRRLILVEDGKEDINAQADAFIKNFRNHLKIQREESFKRYREMLARGV